VSGDFVKELIEGKVDEELGEVWEREDLFFFVDWREEDAQIAACCDALIGPGVVAAEWRGEELVFEGKQRSVVVPLTHSTADRHIALLSLNEALAPELECRYVWASQGADSVAILPLPTITWQALEERHGAAAVDRAFLKLTPFPNVFTDRLERPKAKPRWRFW
jgi:hypothetical protein